MAAANDLGFIRGTGACARASDASSAAETLLRRVRVCVVIAAASKVVFTTGKVCEDDAEPCTPVWNTAFALTETSGGRSARAYTFDRLVCDGSFLRVDVCADGDCPARSCEDAAATTRLASFTVDGEQYKPFLQSLTALDPPGVYGCVRVACVGDGACCVDAADIDLDQMLPGTEIVFGPIGTVPLATALIGPTGPSGPAGAVGPTGPQGPPGIMGFVGLSAPAVFGEVPLLMAFATNAPVADEPVPFDVLSTMVGEWATAPDGSAVIVPVAGVYLVAFAMCFAVDGAAGGGGCDLIVGVTVDGAVSFDRFLETLSAGHEAVHGSAFVRLATGARVGLQYHVIHSTAAQQLRILPTWIATAPPAHASIQLSRISA